MPTPVVLEGLRGSYEARKQEAETKNVTPHAIRPHDVSRGTKYVSKFARYRVSLIPPTRRELMPGVFESVNGANAAFEDHVYVNDGGGLGKGPDPTNREMLDKLLQRNPWYGIGRDFWLASDAQAADARQKVDSAVEAIRRNPEAVKALIDQLRSEGALDWDLPERTPETSEPKKSKDVTKLE